MFEQWMDLRREAGSGMGPASNSGGLKELASRSGTRVRDRMRTAKMQDSRHRISEVGCHHGPRLSTDGEYGGQVPQPM
jgi:hypothetical protein